jgi:hypothetical protein
MLRPERGQPEFPGYEPIGYREVFRNEQPIAHRAILTPLRHQPNRLARGGCAVTVRAPQARAKPPLCAAITVV